MKKLFLFSILMVYSNIVFSAYNKFYPNASNYCTATESTINDYEPNKFQVTNNLLRSAGLYPVYCGEKIVIMGKILDQNCVPVSDAKIYLWQVGCDGKYPYTPLRNRVNKKMLNLNNGSSFTGSGTATTNNKGEFYFVTIYPPSILKEKSHVNIRIEHMNLGMLQTKLYLSDNQEVYRNKIRNPNLTDLDCDVRFYNFDVVMPGETLKRY